MSDNAYLINAITGEMITTNVKFFMSLDEFRDFISQRWNIPHEQLLILLPFGNKLTNASFKDRLRNSGLNENELYVYDRRLFSVINEPTQRDWKLDNEDDQVELFDQAQNLLNSLSRDGMQKKESAFLKPINSPLADADLRLENLDYRTITSLLTTNLGWLSALEIDVHYFRVLIQECVAEVSQILKCLSVCEEYLKIYCYNAEKLYNSNVDFLNQLAQNGLSSKWRDCYNNVLTKLEGLEGPLERYIDVSKMDDNEKVLKVLDQNVNSVLKDVKRELDSYAELRILVGQRIESLREVYTAENMNDKSQKTMLEKFDELVEDTRTNSRDILDQDSATLSDDEAKKIQSFLSRNKNQVSGKLFTIAQALYVQTERVLELKKQLRLKTILVLGQIAYVQVETIATKRKLLHECNRDLERYQEKELEFAQVEDIPLIYGLFLIEKYRRTCWVLQVLSQTNELALDFKQLRSREKDCRSKWIKNFGSTASLFCGDLECSSDFRNLEDITNLKSTDDQIVSLQRSINETLGVIDRYIKQLPLLGVSDNVSGLLAQNLSEAKNYQITALRRRQFPEPTIAARDQINGYRARIKKLESLLHDARYSDPGHWPSGILNTTYVKPFRSNISTVSSRISLNSSIQMEANRDLNVANLIEVENNMRNIEEENKTLRHENDDKVKQLSAARTKISDLELERMAFKETLVYLKNELARLVDQEEVARRNAITQKNDFKLQIQNIVLENSSLLKELDSTKKEIEHADGQKKEMEDRLDQLGSELEQLRETSKKNSASLETNLRELKKHAEQLEEDNQRLKTEQQERHSEIQKIKEERENEIAVTLNKKDEKEESIGLLRYYSKNLETNLFNIFASDVFILENIGLLLSLDNNHQILIKRVKGLRKGQNQGLLDDSVQISETDILVKSTIYKEIKQLYEEVQKKDELKSRNLLVASISKLYNNKLYETAVIRRFKDIETLAKKLTKENKKKKSLLESYQNEKVTLKSFQIGDLALFLPTRENNSPTESSISSLNSSFSSVDLSTPPPFDPSPLHPSSSGKDKVKKGVKNRPWAAFTAFEDNTRYFLKDEDGMVKGKEWFVGRILTMESFIADESGNNPYKLAKGMVWFQVTANVVSCQ